MRCSWRAHTWQHRCGIDMLPTAGDDESPAIRFKRLQSVLFLSRHTLVPYVRANAVPDDNGVNSDDLFYGITSTLKTHTL
jgi:hypothetical protein